MIATEQIPELAVLLLMRGQERWLVLRRRGSLRLLLHSTIFINETFWDDAIKRAQVMGELLHGSNKSDAIRIDLSFSYTGDDLHEWMRDKFLSDPNGMLEIFEHCISSAEDAAQTRAV